jgi:hypothetical protein
MSGRSCAEQQVRRCMCINATLYQRTEHTGGVRSTRNQVSFISNLVTIDSWLQLDYLLAMVTEAL